MPPRSVDCRGSRGHLGARRADRTLIRTSPTSALLQTLKSHYLFFLEINKREMKLKKPHQALVQANNESNLNIALAILFLLYTVGSDLRDQFYFLGWEYVGAGMPSFRAKHGS